MYEYEGTSGGLNFDGEAAGDVAVISVILAPMVPGTVAQAIGAVVLTGILVVHLGFWILRQIALRKAEKGESSTTIQSLISSDTQFSFELSGQTTLILAIALLWLGYAGMLWVFGSFFVLFATGQSLGSTYRSIEDIVLNKKGLDEEHECVFGSETDTRGDGTGGSR